MQHPLCSPPPRLPPSPRGGAGSGPVPERSGGQRRRPSLQYSPTPSLSPPLRCALQGIKRAVTLQNATELSKQSIGDGPVRAKSAQQAWGNGARAVFPGFHGLGPLIQGEGPKPPKPLEKRGASHRSIPNCLLG